MPGLQNFDAQHFLDHYWQRQPLLIKNALPGFRNPLSPEQLAGLALESDVESRIIQQQPSGWKLEHGPFTEPSFNRSGAWTLLVQAVDHHLPELADLWRLTDFLPGWRADDVMVSYATDGAGVGPHYDNYDVFLLQGLGQRQWRLGQWCDAGEALLDDSSLRILADFQQTDDYLLNPGDILYLPPRLAHWGIAAGECMTYSLGFRAPRINDMLSRWLDQILEQMDPEQFYRDPPLRAHLRPGEIDPQAAQQALRLVQEALAKSKPDFHWLGELVTEPHQPTASIDAEPYDRTADTLTLDAEARLAWSRSDEMLTVFANGVSLPAHPECQPLLEQLCNVRFVSVEQFAALAGENGTQRELISQLIAVGCVYAE